MGSTRTKCAYVVLVRLESLTYFQGMSKSKKTRNEARPKRKPTVAERRARRERRKKFVTIFSNGKQKRLPRPPTIDGLPVDEFLARSADPIWLHQNELWERARDPQAAMP
jgi:hypothetical protein